MRGGNDEEIWGKPKGDDDKVSGGYQETQQRTCNQDNYGDFTTDCKYLRGRIFEKAFIVTYVHFGDIL